LGEFEGTSRFEIRRRLGAGGMGVVYEAYDRDRDARVALKTVKHADADALYRFKAEFRALQDIDHPNVIRLGELIADEGTWFFTMEYVAGVDFLTHVRSSAAGDDATAETLRPATVCAFDERKLRAAAIQLAGALRALHAADLVHRDVKPSNVLVADDRVVLLDFGLVTVATPEGESTGDHIVGTAAYMAPEQAASGKIGPAADWYGFGALLYEALTLRPPFAGSTYEVLLAKQRYEPPAPSTIAAGVPSDLDVLCRDLLRRDPAARPSGERILERLGAPVRTLAAGSSYRRRHATQTGPFVGRAQELEVLRGALRRTRTGVPAVLLVRGESGVGKTELVKHFADHAQQDDAECVVLTGRCYERESVPYKGFDSLADALGRYLGRLPAADCQALMPTNAYLLPRLFPVLSRVRVIANSPRAARQTEDPRELRARMFEALRDLLVRLALRRPLVLFIDDLQWADADSLTLLREILHPPDGPDLLLVATVRADRPLPALDDLGELVRTLEVDNLGEDEARELVDLLAPDADVDATARIVSEAGGHPLFIQELARSSDGDSSRTSLDQVMWRRAARLDPGALQLLELLCVAAEPLGLDVCADVLGAEQDECERWAAQLRVASFARHAGIRHAEQFEPYHDRVRACVLARVRDDAVRKLHGDLAGALERSGAAPEAILRHLRAAGDLARAAELAEQAGRRAQDTLAFDRAAELFLEALELGDPDPVRARELSLLAATALMNAGRSARAGELFLAAADGADSVERLDRLRLAAEMLLISGYIEEGLRALRFLLTDIDVAYPSTPRRALMMIARNRIWLRLRGLGWHRREAEELPASTLRAIDTLKAAAHGLTMVDTIRGLAFQSRHLLLSLRAGEPSRIVTSLAREAGFLAFAGPKKARRVAALVRKARAAAAEVDSPYAVAWCDAAEGSAAYFLGRFEECRRRAAPVIAQFEALDEDTSWELTAARFFHAQSLQQLGEFAELAELARACLRDARRRGDRHTEAIFRKMPILGWLATGGSDLARAQTAFEPWSPGSDAYHLHHWYTWRARAEIALYDGTAGQVRQDAERELAMIDAALVARAHTLQTMTQAIWGRIVIGSREDLGLRETVRQVRRTVRRLMKQRVPYADVEACLLEATADALTGRDQRAIATLGRAIAVADEQGLRFHAAAAHHARGTLTRGDAGRADLDAAEAYLRAQGCTEPDKMIRVYAPGFDR